MREVTQVEVEGSRLVGTLHWSTPGQRQQPDVASLRGKIGILHGSVGWLPRSSRGDMAAHMADFTAELGYPSFRFDMPGLGDSPGDLPADVLPLFELVQEGGHVRFFSALQTELIRRYELSGLILLGHCGSATTAVYCVAPKPPKEIHGLILLEPAFVWRRAPGAPSRGLQMGRASVRGWLAGFAAGKKVVSAYLKIKALGQRLRGGRAPADANKRFLACLKSLLTNRVPLLVITAPPHRKLNYFDYVRFLQRGRTVDTLDYIQIEGTDHAFLAGNGAQRLFAEVQKWLSNRFPIERNEAETGIVPSRMVSNSDKVEVHSMSSRIAVV